MQMAAAAAVTTTNEAPVAATAAVAHHHPHAHGPPVSHPHHHIPRWVVIPYPPPPGMVAAPPPPPPQFVKHFAPPPQSVTPPPPPQPQPHQPAGGSGGNGAEENRTIWVGDLQYWMDENYLHNCFGSSHEVVTIKVIRNRHSGVSEGYGFVEFFSHESAEKALQNFSGHVMPNTDRAFKLNWASYSMGEKRSELASDHSIFVGDLAVDVTDEMLMGLFASKYRSVKGAKVIIDANTGRSRGYGFVRFGDDSDKTRAMTEMNGEYCSTRQIRIGPATPRRSSGDSGSSPPRQSDNDSTNRTIYVGGLDPNVTEEELRKAFAKYGDLASVKIPVGKQCGFVQFVNRPDAEEALQGLNGSTIGKQAVRLSWGRSPASKQSRGDSGHRRNGMYYGTPFYGGYGYASPLPHPNMYAAAYGAYPYYGNQQLVS
uniref:RRM domain-containing protein n=1 Tax=Leersia perrieri TaxID=77586 RepID=A0A0D9VHB6_9ORYZ